ncbi:DegT/DnrJ/EryC1/StrS family aminotransferase [Rubrivivax sp. RP6-9]|uniref:DegT/DnrJ/EryC1/StrS family aminotransferase n=1 Tax=Rubrivivax sp. RP6-9 TaxID=3415750 RepID=UPI003CC684CE
MITNAITSVPRLPVFGWRSMLGPKDAGVSSILDRSDAIFTSSGSAAIFHALLALGVERGDGVLLPNYHCPTMISPAATLGARLAFYPIDSRGHPKFEILNRLDISRVRVLHATHLFGFPTPMAELRRWCDQRNIALLEDCAHAMFGLVDGRPIGNWGDASIASLPKFLPAADGGILLLNGPAQPPRLSSRTFKATLHAIKDIAEIGAMAGALPGLNQMLMGGSSLIRWIRGTGARPESGSSDIESPFPKASARSNTKYFDSSLAKRQSTAPSRWVAKSLPRARVVDRRRANYRRLSEELRHSSVLRPLFPDLPEGVVPYMFPLWVDQPDPGCERLRAQGIPVFRWDRLWAGASQDAGDYGTTWAHHVLQIPCHQDIGERELTWMVRVLLEVFTEDKRFTLDTRSTSTP